MPFEIGGHVQSVVVQGRVYVGGGYTPKFTDNYVIMEYTTLSGEWTTLKLYKTRWFAMATINNQLVLVGGKEQGKASRELGVWEADRKEWTHPYPEMPTGRWRCSAVVHNEWLVVVGGVTPVQQYTSSVEVLNVSTNQWHSGPPSPLPLTNMKTATMEDSFYFMGGCARGFHIDHVYSLPIQTLITYVTTSTKEEPGTWKVIPGLKLNRSTPLTIGGFLFAMGGIDKDRKMVSTIHRYQPDTEEWVKAGDLKLPCCDCTCILSTRTEVVVAGGNKEGTTGILRRMDISALS